MKKRFFSLFTMLIMVVSLVGGVPSMTAEASGGVQTKVNALINKYKGSTSSFNHGGASGCLGFAKVATEYVFGVTFYRNNQNGAFGKVGSSSSFSSIYNMVKPGDIIDNGSPHTAMVTSKGNNTFTLIHWRKGSVTVNTFNSSSWNSWGFTSYSNSVWRANNYSSVDGSSSGGSTASKPTFGTPYTTSVGNNSAYIKCSLYKNGSNWNSVGAYYGTSTSNMTKAGSDNLASGATWSGYTLSNLKAGTTYYYKFYIVANGTTYWSNVSSFKTTGGSLKFTSNCKATGITQTSATLNAEIYIPSGTGEIVSWSFKYKSGNSNWIQVNSSEHNWNDSSKIFTFKRKIDGLKSGTSYQFRITVKCGNKEYYNDGYSFTTLSHIHSYTSTVVSPTCTSQGYTLHKCSCGESYKDKFTSATGHKYQNGICTVCGGKDPNYKDFQLLTTDFIDFRQNNTSATQPATAQVTENAAKATRLAKVTNLYLKKGSKRTAKIAWRKVNGAKGYQVKWSVNKKFKKAKKKFTKKNCITLKRLNKNRYYVKVRAYKTVNGKKVYGKWSRVLKLYRR